MQYLVSWCSPHNYVIHITFGGVQQKSHDGIEQYSWGLNIRKVEETDDLEEKERKKTTKEKEKEEEKKNKDESNSNNNKTEKISLN